jgi:hypothetical protein
MLISLNGTFSDEQEETTVATHDSTNVIDLGDPGDAVARTMRFHGVVHTAVTSGGAATVQCRLTTSDTEIFTATTVLWASEAIAKASLVAGYKFTGKEGIRIPSGCLQYLQVEWIIGTAVLTAGKFNAFLSPDAQSNNFLNGVGA